jgi:hypothetical protein
MARAKTGQKPSVNTDHIKRAKRTTALTSLVEPEAAKGKGEKPQKPVELQMYTIPQFCEAHNISIDSYYRMQRAGDGPEIKKVGHGTRISVEAAKAWREKGKAATETAEAKEQRLARKAASTATSAEA